MTNNDLKQMVDRHIQYELPYLWSCFTTLQSRDLDPENTDGLRLRIELLELAKLGLKWRERDRLNVCEDPGEELYQAQVKFIKSIDKPPMLED